MFYIKDYFNNSKRNNWGFNIYRLKLMQHGYAYKCCLLMRSFSILVNTHALRMIYLSFIL